MGLSLESAGRDFRIVFRTFGIDIKDVSSEFNLFCCGKHPCFEQVPSTLSRFVVDVPQDTGSWSLDEHGLHLVLHGKEQVHGYQQCVTALTDRLFDAASPSFSLALQDFFPWWRKCG